MNAPTKQPKTGLDLLREPFPANLISKLPKPTKAQTEAVRANFKAGVRCKICGTWHHPDVVHLDYVGHAALTDRLLDCDPNWGWEPVAYWPNGTPLMDENGGMWIKLTVCGVTRLGYGHPDGKRGGDAIKEVIGDALRNAAMRFGAALDLWHKGDLHADDPAEPPKDEPKRPTRGADAEAAQIACDSFAAADTLDALASIWRDLPAGVKSLPAVTAAKDARKAALTPKPADDLGGDEIPY